MLWGRNGFSISKFLFRQREDETSGALDKLFDGGSKFYGKIIKRFASPVSESFDHVLTSRVVFQNRGFDSPTRWFYSEFQPPAVTLIIADFDFNITIHETAIFEFPKIQAVRNGFDSGF